MIKSGNTQDLHHARSRTRRPARQTASEPSVLEPPPSISLDDLRALIPGPSTEAGRTGLDSPKGNSLEKLQELVKPQGLDTPPEIDLDDLRDLLEPAGIVTEQVVRFRTRDFLVPKTPSVQAASKFRAWQNVTVSPTSSVTTTISSPEADTVGSAPTSNASGEERRLPDISPTCSGGTKVKIVEKRNDADIKLDGPEAFLKKLEQLAMGDNLENWIASLNLPKELDLKQTREHIKTFLKEKCWEKDVGLRFKIMDGSAAKTLWAWFKDLSIAKQILVVIGLALLAASVGFLSIQFIALVWPSVVGAATSGEAVLREIAVEGFKFRQEPAFHLLHLHAEQAKPMSYAWANQYVLWKYCRNLH